MEGGGSGGERWGGEEVKSEGWSGGIEGGSGASWWGGKGRCCWWEVKGRRRTGREMVRRQKGKGGKTDEVRDRRGREVVRNGVGRKKMGGGDSDGSRTGRGKCGEDGGREVRTEVDGL